VSIAPPPGHVINAPMAEIVGNNGRSETADDVTAPPLQKCPHRILYWSSVCSKLFGPALLPRDQYYVSNEQSQRVKPICGMSPHLQLDLVRRRVMQRTPAWGRRTAQRYRASKARRSCCGKYTPRGASTRAAAVGAA